MPTTDAYTKADRLHRLIKMFEQRGVRLRTSEIASRLGVSDDTVKSYIDELSHSGRLPLDKEGHYWQLAEDAHLSQLQVRLDNAEATSLYVAARLLSQIQDEPNVAVVNALYKLIDALPVPLQEHQRTLIGLVEQRQQKQSSYSHIFKTIALGWAQQKKVKLLYDPPGKSRFECLFSPYLLEPSGIGRTIYAIGKSEPLNELRTYKLERIEQAQIMEEEPFTIDKQFDVLALIQRAWGVMYGDEELINIRLHFSYRVTRRLKETQWHPSQKICDTPKGCEFRVQIGDSIEIENWIRGWGSDCEVLEPASLRQKIVDDVRRSMRTYNLFSNQSNDDDSEDDLLPGYFGGEQ